jgi:hypothetical protein
MYSFLLLFSDNFVFCMLQDPCHQECEDLPCKNLITSCHHISHLSHRHHPSIHLILSVIRRIPRCRFLRHQFYHCLPPSQTLWTWSMRWWPE